MEGNIKCATTQHRKSPVAGQISAAEGGHAKVVGPVLDGGAWWSHPTPSPGSLQKQEIENSRKDPFFYQIPTCNLAPSEQGVERKDQGKAKLIHRVGRQKPNADTDYMFWHLKGILRNTHKLLFLKSPLFYRTTQTVLCLLFICSSCLLSTHLLI